MQQESIALYQKMAYLQWLFHRYHIKKYIDRPAFSDPTRGQGRVLAALKQRTGISTRALSNLLGIRTQSLNELLSKLEKSGYVMRMQSETDRRVVLVFLTEKGAEVQSEEEDTPPVINCLNEAEQAQFSAYIERIIAEFETELEYDGKIDKISATALNSVFCQSNPEDPERVDAF